MQVCLKVLAMSVEFCYLLPEYIFAGFKWVLLLNGCFHEIKHSMILMYDFTILFYLLIYFYV